MQAYNLTINYHKFAEIQQTYRYEKPLGSTLFEQLFPFIEAPRRVRNGVELVFKLRSDILGPTCKLRNLQIM